MLACLPNKSTNTSQQLALPLVITRFTWICWVAFYFRWFYLCFENHRRAAHLWRWSRTINLSKSLFSAIIKKKTTGFLLWEPERCFPLGEPTTEHLRQSVRHFLIVVGLLCVLIAVRLRHCLNLWLFISCPRLRRRRLTVQFRAGGWWSCAASGGFLHHIMSYSPAVLLLALIYTEWIKRLSLVWGPLKPHERSSDE